MSNSGNKERLFIVGAGGQARVVLSIVRSLGLWNPMSIIDTSFRGTEEKIDGIEVSGGIATIEPRTFDTNRCVLAIGCNRERRRWRTELRHRGFEFPSLVSPLSLVDETATIGQGSIVCPFAFVGPSAVIGKNTIVNTRASIEHESRVGDHCHISPSTTLAGRCRVGNEVLIGMHSCILPNITIGDSITVGALSMVNKNLLEPGVYFGSPARRRIDS